MMQLSICMPSNRPFATSRRAIETALAYCEMRNAILIVSDNSGDVEKREYWQRRSPKIKYLVSDGTDAMTNFMTAFLASETPFILPMGDDDEIKFNPKIPAFDFANLPSDHIGVRPITEIWTEEKGTIRVKSFAITSDHPVERIIEYSQAASGDNSAFYSVFRRSAYLDLMDLFNRHHPTKGAYCDWSQVTALISYGKMALDQGTLYRYNISGWQSNLLIEKNILKAFTDAGLSEDAQKYEALLRYLDIFVFISSRKSPPTQGEMDDVKAFLSGPVLGGFFSTVSNRSNIYSETMRYLAEIAEKEQDSMGRFRIALLMIGQLREDLKDRYLEYYKVALQYESIV